MMSVQEYPTFSKKCQKDAKKKKYTFGTPGISEGTLTWFKERTATKSRNSTPKSTKSTPGPVWIAPKVESTNQTSVKPTVAPPGLIQKKNTVSVSTSTEESMCNLCNQLPTDKTMLTNCNHTFCLDCIYKHKHIWNRCPTCCKVIDYSKIEKYEGTVPTIPIYESFSYIGEDEYPIDDPIIYDTNGLLEFSTINYSTPLAEIEPVEIPLQTNYNIQADNYLDYSVLLAQYNNIIAQFILQNYMY